MMRRLLNDKNRRPDYLAVVYDHPSPTFRDKLFAAYKAQRPPMPDELSIQMPFVRRYCEAMRLPILEYPGYEADDVIGSLVRQARKEDLEVFIVTSDKDLMQLVGGSVRMLNPTKGDLIIDEKMVEELMGVPPNKVPDVMALMGDSIDNIPGARDPNDKPAPGERRKAGIGGVGARQLIQQFGSAEEALKRASEVKRSSYREALEKCGEFVMLSKQLSTIPTDAPVPLDLEALRFSSRIFQLSAIYMLSWVLHPCFASSLPLPYWTIRKVTTPPLHRPKNSRTFLATRHATASYQRG